jgi:ribonuclease T2
MPAPAIINPIMKNSLLLAALLLAPAARAQQGPITGNFSSYVFVLEWMPEFCATVPGSSECAALASGSFAANHPVLHGLWPNRSGDTSHSYGYCGAAVQQRALDRSSTWCQLPLPPLSDATRASLDQYMPGTASCLEHHEWTRHGTCSGLSADAYFSTEASLAAAVDRSAFGAFLTRNAGASVDRSAVLARFEAAYGTGTSSSVTLHCASSNGESVLGEIHVSLTPTLLPAARLADMLTAPEASDATNCPSSFRLLPAR